MRYVGGKSRHAKEIAKAIAPQGLWWDAFCGGFAVSEALMRYGPGVASDAHPALISMYQALREGWKPPRSMSAEDHARAKTLPDSDPLKAFAGFGCSFGGMYFATFAWDSKGARNYARESADALAIDLASVQILRLDFLDVEPFPVSGLTIYCDPPYQGTQGYSTGPFDHARFWARARAWAGLGARVFVSEYACPVPHRVVWEKRVTTALHGGAKSGARLEKLFALHSPDVDDSRPHQNDREGASAR
jgi:DNA adenine methylase